MTDRAASQPAQPDVSAVGAWLAAHGEAMAHAVTQFVGTTTAFVLAVTVVVLWAVLGPVFGYKDQWQLVINTGTTIVTFLMVFLIQRAQNKDAVAIHLKLNEIVAALPGASNRLVASEDLTEAELETLRKRYRELIFLARREADLFCSHSVEEAARRHPRKASRRQEPPAED